MTSQNYLSIYAKSFNWAGFFLPKETYKKCSDLYNFCRHLDNIADDKDQLENKKIKFNKFKDEFKSQNFSNPIVERMWNLIKKLNISTNIVFDLFDGVESDLNKKIEINSEKELLVYSYRVAGTVGLLMAKILNVKKVIALKGALDLGIAMKLTNIYRDVVEDKKQNRFYIGYDFDQIKDTLKLADKFYNSSFYAMKEIPFRLRFSICVARRVYRKIGYNILKKKNFEEYEKSGKIYVNSFGKIIQTVISIIDMIILSFSKSPSLHQVENKHKIIMEEINLNERF